MSVGWFAWLLACALLGLAACGSVPEAVPATPVPHPDPVGTLSVAWVNSYAPNDFWFLQFQTGVLETLARAGYSRAEGNLSWHAAHLDVCRFASLEDAASAVDEIIAKLAPADPDVILLAGDEAASLVPPRYPDPAQPFVFAGLRGNPQDYGLDRATVTGVLERANPMQTVALARSFVEEADAYLILSDASLSGRSSLDFVHETLLREDDDAAVIISRAAASWPAWQEAVLQETVDLDFILLGSYRTLVDAEGRCVPGDTVLAWMFENAPVPVFALSNHAVAGREGAVAGLVTSGYEQGEAAAQRVVQIAQGASPATLVVREAPRNILAINLQAARNWALPIPFTLPSVARVYSWGGGLESDLQGGP